MTSYAELDRIRKQARHLYLELRALGLELQLEERQEDPTGYVVKVGGLKSLSEAHADRVRRRVEEHKPGLVKLLSSWDADLEAVRKEGLA